MKQTWRDRPTIIDQIPKDDTMLLFIDESGEGNLKKLKNAFENRKLKSEYDERSDLYILNGVAITGKNHENLQLYSNKIKKKLFENGEHDYKNHGIRPVVFRSYDIAKKTPPFEIVNDSFFEEINKLITRTPYKQISAGINYYVYTRRHKEITQMNPLLGALGCIVTNYAEYLNSTNSKGIIVFEEETKIQDALKLKYIKKLLYFGNNTNPKEIYSNITAVYFRKKWTEDKNNKKSTYTTTAGIELADLSISAIRRILHVQYLMIESKFLNYPQYRNKGLTFID